MGTYRWAKYKFQCKCKVRAILTNEICMSSSSSLLLSKLCMLMMDMAWCFKCLMTKIDDWVAWFSSSVNLGSKVGFYILTKRASILLDHVRTNSNFSSQTASVLRSSSRGLSRTPANKANRSRTQFHKPRIACSIRWINQHPTRLALIVDSDLFFA